MSRRTRKKRTHRLKPTSAYRHGLIKAKLWAPSILRALYIPVLSLSVYLLLKASGLFSVYYKELHIAAWALFVLWLVQAIRGAVGYWAHRAHLSFFIPAFFLILVGSSWASFTEAPVKVWVTPPPYAHLPSEALTDQFWKEQPPVLEGSQIHVSWEDEEYPVEVAFNGKEERLDFYGIHEPVATFIVPVRKNTESYELVARSRWLRLGSWRFRTLSDKDPKVDLIADPEVTVRKTIRFAYKASDDFGVRKVVARVTPTASSLQESVRSVEVTLRSPAKKKIETTSYVDLTSLPWAGIPVTVQLVVIDGAGQQGYSAPKVLTLPSRRFQNPFARALIEEREKLLRQPDASMRDEAANVMAGIARQQSIFKGDPAIMMALRAGAVRLVVNNEVETVPTIASILWKAAIHLEEGELGAARRSLAQTERELTSALAGGLPVEVLQPYVTRLSKSLSVYFIALDEAKAKQVPSLQEIDWPIAGREFALSSEDLQDVVGGIARIIKDGKRGDAAKRLMALRETIENLRTTPPELTEAQARLARQVSALRTLVKAQKELIASLDALANANRKTYQGRKAYKNGLAHQVAQQKLVLSSLSEVITGTDLKSLEAKAGELAMKEAIRSLTTKKLKEAEGKQAEALALLENSLLALTEQMQSALATKAP